MPDTQPSTDPVTDPVSEATNQANEALNAAMEGARKLLEEAGQNSFQFAAYQAAVGAMTLTLHNAVAEQQHANILRMAATTAASNAMLEGRKADAEQLIAMTKAELVTPSVTDLMAQIRSCIDSLNQGLHAKPTTAAKTVSKAAKKTAARKTTAKKAAKAPRKAAVKTTAKAAAAKKSPSRTRRKAAKS